MLRGGEDRAMIMRVFRVVAQPGKRDEFETFFRETAIPLMNATPGCLQVIPGTPREETPDEFCIVMVWESLAAMVDFIGEDWRSPHIHADEAALVKERHIHHYEFVGG